MSDAGVECPCCGKALQVADHVKINLKNYGKSARAEWIYSRASTRSTTAMLASGSAIAGAAQNAATRCIQQCMGTRMAASQATNRSIINTCRKPPNDQVQP